MPQDTTHQGEHGQAGLGRLLMNGAVRLGRQVRLSKGQAAALAVFLVGAVGLGLAIEPGRQEPSRPLPPLPETGSEAAGGDAIERIDAAERASIGPDAAKTEAADVGPTGSLKAVAQPDVSRPGSSAADAATNATLEKLAVEIAKINKRLDEVVSSERLTLERVAALGSLAPARASGAPAYRGVSPDRDAGAPRPAPSPGGLKTRHEALTVHRAPPAVAQAEAPPLRRAARPTQVTDRFGHQAFDAHPRRLAGLRTFSGPPPHF